MQGPFLHVAGSQSSSAASSQPDDLAGLGKAVADSAGRMAAVNHRGFERLPDQHLGLRAKRSMVSMHNVRLPTGPGMMPLKTIERRGLFTVGMAASLLHFPASAKPLASSF